MLKHVPSKSQFTSLALTFSFVLFMNTPVHAQGDGNLFENLEPVEGAKAALVEIDPEADFTVYKRVNLLDAFVAFKKGWERNQQRSGSRMRISTSDMERIKTDVSSLFNEVFAEVLAADDGYEIVDETGEDVLLIRPAIIDLDVVAPDTNSMSRGASFTAETGSATIYVELFDSSTSQIIGRAADRQTIRNAGDMVTWSNRVTNTAGARRLFTVWAQALRDFLDKHYMDAE